MFHHPLKLFNSHIIIKFNLKLKFLINFTLEAVAVRPALLEPMPLLIINIFIINFIDLNKNLITNQ